MRRILAFCVLLLVSFGLSGDTIVCVGECQGSQGQRYCHSIYPGNGIGCRGWQQGNVAFCIPYYCNHARAGLTSNPWNRNSRELGRPTK
jgi:hypothetical protein